jgi:uncharacterized protein (TIGR01244 family)
MCYLYATRLTPTDLKWLSDTVAATSQLKPENFSFLRRQRIWRIVDLRPDGEAADQPSSEVMKRAAAAQNMEFAYVPIPHESIPDASVDALTAALQDHGFTVLYCRSGRRAVRTFALVEASRPGGPSVEEILKMVVDAGFTAEDLKANIIQRIAARRPLPATKP